MESRRGVLAGTAALVAAPLLSPLAAHADVYGANSQLPTNLNDINKYLKELGFPAMKGANGLTPLIEYAGTGPPANIDGNKVRERKFDGVLLVRFLYPNGWLVSRPDTTENGEAGTIGANNFQKGDSEIFTSMPLPQGKALKDMKNDFYKDLITSQMTSDVYEDVKPKKIVVSTTEGGTEIFTFDFTYTLLTRAGFTVNRFGIATAQQVGNSAVALVCATTTLRYKEVEPLFRESINSFRVYPVKGVQLPGER
jgi:hypothetical protein